MPDLTKSEIQIQNRLDKVNEKKLKNNANKIKGVEYDDASVLTTDPTRAKKILDLIYDIPLGRRAEPPSYNDYIVYDHRLNMNEYNLRIGDSVFMIPPEFIQVKTITEPSINVGLRQMNTVKTNNGYIQKEIVITLIFNGYEQINGYEVKSPFSFPYYVDGLRPLLAQFRCAPFLPIQNELLNATHDIHTVALQNLTVTTIPGFPECLKAILVFKEFNCTPYIEAPEYLFDEFIDWDLYRYYYQRFLKENPSTNIKLNKTNTSNLTGEFTISMLNSEILDGMSTDNIFDKTKYTTILTNNDNVHITELSFNYSNILPILQLSNDTSPTMQYLGGMDTIFNISFETTDKGVLNNLRTMVDVTSDLARTHRELNKMGFILFENELYKLSGSSYAIVNEIVVSTVEEFPDLFKIDLQCISYDPTQYKTQDLVGFRPFDGIGGKEQTLDQNKDGLKRKIIQDLYVEEKLLNLELYPDLCLPTYSDINNAIDFIRAFRELNGLTQVKYKVYPAENSTNIKIKSKKSIYVDPDFYVFYPFPYSDIKNDSFEAIKGPTTPKPSPSTYYSELPVGEDNVDDPISDDTSDNASDSVVTGGASGSTLVDLAMSRAKLKCGYIWGASGETLTESFLKQMKNNFGSEHYSSYANQWMGKQVFDCSGLVSWCLREMGVMQGRKNVANLKPMCDLFAESSKLKVGDLCFRNESHVAIYIGNKQTVEAMDTEHGVVIGKLEGRGFNLYGTLKNLPNSSPILASSYFNTSALINNPIDGEWPKVNAWNTPVLNASRDTVFDPNLIKAIIWVESKGDMKNPKVINPNAYNCVGLMQVGPLACAQVGIDWKKAKDDTTTNILAGTKYLEWCYNTYGKDIHKAIVRYNGSEAYYTTVWNAYKHINPNGTGYKTYTHALEITDTFVKQNNETFGNGSKEYLGVNISSPVFEESPLEHVSNFQKFRRGEDYLDTMFVDEAIYSRKGRLLRAFPTFLIMFLDSNDNWFDGRKLWTNYYVYKSVIDISVSQIDNNPVHTATIKLTNTNHNLDTPTSTKSISEILKHDEELSIFSKFLYNSFGSIIGGPKITDKIVEMKNELYNKINVSAGCRMHIRIGYGSNPITLPTVFNGIITEIDTQEVVTIVGESDGAELVNNVISASKDETNRITKFQSEPSNIVSWILTERDNWFFNSINHDFCEKNKYGIEHFGLPIEHHADADDEYDLLKNVYVGNYKGYFYNEPNILFDSEENINFYLFNRTPWDCMQMAAQSVPEFICAPMYHGFESRIFLGLPDWIARYRYDMVDGKIYESGKSFAQYHFINSMNDIIDNQVRVTSKDLKINAIGTYSRGNTLKSTPLLYADRSIDWDKQKTKVIDTTVVQDYLGPDWVYEKFVPVGRSAAIRVCISNILDSFKEMYKGDIIILGNPGIKPFDYIYLNDEFTNMSGMSVVREVVHNFSVDTGFTTYVAPGVISESALHNAGTINKVKTFLCFGVSVAAAWKVRSVGITLARKLGKEITAIKGTVNGVSYKAGTKTVDAAKSIKKALKDGSIFKDFGKTLETFNAEMKALQIARNEKTLLELSEVIENTTMGVKATVNSIKAGIVASGSAVPIIGNIIAFIVTTILFDSILNFVIDQFAWNRCVRIYPLLYKNKPFVSGVNGYKTLIPGFDGLNNEYLEVIKPTDEEILDVIKKGNYDDLRTYDYTTGTFKTNPVINPSNKPITYPPTNTNTNSIPAWWTPQDTNTYGR